ncbi:Sodium/calcium exchanger protein-domain-containing protein [Melanogaster broomeanus]|nr:Sodium/calcium exchanger protein-domain-containing protein [Melanogaster broomeanus]
METDHNLVFIFCILSTIPLVKLHDLATRELALRIGGTKAGLLNASMITALRKCELRICSSFGMCFFAGGLRFSEQGFDQTATRIHSSLLSISVGALLLPAAYHFSLSGIQDSSSAQQWKDILKMSHGVSTFYAYVAYLLFQFWSHRHLYKDTRQKSNKLAVKMPINPPPRCTRIPSLRVRAMDHRQRSRHSSSRMGTLSTTSLRQFSLPSSSEVTLTNPASTMLVTSFNQSPPSNPSVFPVAQSMQDQTSEVAPGSTASPELARRRLSQKAPTITVDTSHCSSPQPMTATELPQSGELDASKVSTESFKEPRLSLFMTLLLLILVTIMVSFNAEDLVESLDGISTSIEKQWIGLVLLPAVSSIPECITAMNASAKDQLSLSVSVAVGSTIQTTLFIIPFIVILGWILNKPLTLLFDPFEYIASLSSNSVLYISVQTMSYVVADGKSNWLEGAILICLYVIIAVSFWYYPGKTRSQANS